MIRDIMAAVGIVFGFLLMVCDPPIELLAVPNLIGVLLFLIGFLIAGGGKEHE